MLLKELKNKEIQAFMKLLLEFVKVDNKIARGEKELIKKFQKALGQDINESENIKYEEAIEILNEASSEVRKIVYFELLGVALVDGEYESSEIDFLESLSNKLGVDRASKFAFANYYYDFDSEKVKSISEEELELRKRNLILA